jgi:8-oxo-dGTP diphosphatase
MKAAIAIIRNKTNRRKILAVSRRDDLTDMGLPGGKIEATETVEEGLLREVEEEVGLRILSFRPILIRTSNTFLVHVFEVLEWEGQPTSREGTTIEWLSETELSAQKTFGAFNRSALKEANR